MQIAIERQDGGVSIMTLQPGTDPETEINAWAESGGLQPKSWRVVTPDNLPPDRTFRNAWRATEAGIVVDLPAARELHLTKIRQIRDRELAKTDGPFLRAWEQGNEPERNRLAADRQRLRDLPQTFDLTVAHTAEALAALWPDGLPKK